MDEIKKPFDNEERRRYYGKRVGDRVKQWNGPLVGDVVAYGFMDNNRVHVLWDGAMAVSDFVAEWLDIIEKVEDRKDYKPVYVLQTGCYTFGQSNLGESSGLIGQVTKLLINCRVVYTRETVRGVDSFLVGSGERWGDKTGKTPVAARQALDLLAPPDVWDEIAAIVKEQDTMKRPVMKNKKFTQAWAEKHLRPTKSKS